MADSTTINIHRDTWHQLHQRKDIGESFDDVIKELIERADKCDGADADTNGQETDAEPAQDTE